MINEKESINKHKERFALVDEYGDVRYGFIAVIAIITFIVLGTIFGLISEFYQVIEPSNQGLVIKGGELQGEPLKNGFYWKTPFWTEIVPVFIGTISTDNNDAGEFTEEPNPFRGIQPLSKDGQVLEIDVQINYAITDTRLFREKTGSTNPRTIEQLLLVPTIRRFVYDYASEYGWKALIQEGDRQEFGQRVFLGMTTGQVNKRSCQEETKKIDEKTGTEIIIEAGCYLTNTEIVSTAHDYGITISAVNFKKIKPNQKIISAVEEAQAKEQEVKIAQQEAEIAKQQANKAIETKRGETESKKLEVDAQAYKLRVEKEEEAKGVSALAAAEKERASALAASQQLVEYKKLDIEMKEAEALVEFGKNWKGDVPDNISIIGTDEAKDMNLFFGMSGVVANPSN
jgi:regulator of protease activity HflC (stomatin/prohibitin superfamily)